MNTYVQFVTVLTVPLFITKRGLHYPPPLSIQYQCAIIFVMFVIIIHADVQFIVLLLNLLFVAKYAVVILVNVALCVFVFHVDVAYNVTKLIVNVVDFAIISHVYVVPLVEIILVFVVLHVKIIHVSAAHVVTAVNANAVLNVDNILVFAVRYVMFQKTDAPAAHIVIPSLANVAKYVIKLLVNVALIVVAILADAALIALICLVAAIIAKIQKIKNPKKKKARN